jgi:nitroreductase
MIDEIYTRRSIRSYNDKTIQNDDLKLILSAGLSAPNGINLAPLEMVVIRTPEAKEQIASIYPPAQFCRQAPVSVLICYDENKNTAYAKANSYGPLDAAAAAQNMVLTATHLGIASCWTHAWSHIEQYQQLCKLPSTIIPVALLVLGYSDTLFSKKDGYDASKIHYEKW